MVPENIRFDVVKIYKNNYDEKNFVGTGFIFKGGILTAKHLIESFTSNIVLVNERINETISIVNIEIKSSQISDIAYTKINSQLLSSYSDVKISDEELYYGQELYVLGFHKGKSSEEYKSPSFKKIYVSDPYHTDQIELEFNNILGFSGSPIFDMEWNLVSVISGKLSIDFFTHDIMELLWAIKSKRSQMSVQIGGVDTNRALELILDRETKLIDNVSNFGISFCCSTMELKSLLG